MKAYLRTYFCIPEPALTPYVQRILVIEDWPVKSSFTLPLFANGFPTLLFQTAKGSLLDNQSGHLFLFGQTILPDSLRLNERFSLIAYFLKPIALVSLFGIEARELTDRPLDLTLWRKAEMGELVDRLLNASSISAAMEILAKFIQQLMDRRKFDDAILQFATARMFANTSPSTLLQVQKELHLTERTWQRLFEKNIGIRPGLFRRICQFSKTFDQLNGRRFTSLTDLAHQNGYADQSHFIRTFKEFTRITPSEYLNLGRPPDE